MCASYILLQGSNLVTLNYTKASATKQNDGSILCTPEDITDIRE